jgi:hypothetical protein
MLTSEQLLRKEEFERGFAQGQREFLLDLLTEHFGTLPAAVIERVARASLEDLKRWGKRIRRGASLDDVFAGPRLTFMELLRQEEFDKGYQHGLRQFLLGQLTERFGSLPATIARRVDQGSRADLERWIDRVFHAASLDDVFASL